MSHLPGIPPRRQARVVYEMANGIRLMQHLLSGKDPSKAELEEILANLPNARAVLSRLSVEELQAAGGVCISRAWPAPLEEIVVELLQRCANEASARSDRTMWIGCLEVLMRLRPADLGYRLQILHPLAGEGAYGQIIELMEPHLDILLLPEHLGSLAQHSAFTTSAAYQIGRLDLVRRIRDGRAPTGFPAPEAEAALRRAAALEQAGFGNVPIAKDLSPYCAALRDAALALDEYSVLKALNALSVMIPDAAAEIWSLRLAISVAGIMLHESWGRPYRAALNIAAGCLARSAAIEDARAQWSMSGLPEASFEPFLILTGRRPEAASGRTRVLLCDQPEWKRAREEGGLATDSDEEAAFLETLRDFYTSPDLDRASRVWSHAYLAGRFADLVNASPTSPDPGAPVERARSLQFAPLPDAQGVPLWLMMTCHKEPDQVLRKLAAYAGDATIVVSIGGDARPPGLARLTAALFCARIQFLVRPVVGWGGQRAGFHNVLEVLELFKTEAEPDAWFQLVCDRTYPLKSLRRLAQMTAGGDVFRPCTTTPAWRGEWADDIANTLPKVYADAMNEAFSTGAPKKFIELATQSPMHNSGDLRLSATMWNYSSRALPVDWDGRSSWHNYAISPFQADVRWMSFARLQELIDVSTEAKTTYARRMHPSTMRWAHSVLMKYTLRIGDPWVYISKPFVDRVLDDPGFDEVFAVMNLGFAPEMNFLDTFAASRDLLGGISHHYHINPAEVASDSFLPEVCKGADQFQKPFVRKTDPGQSERLMTFFSERIVEERVGQGLHWMVGGGAFADDLDEPRPRIDQALLNRFIRARVDVRDMIGRRTVQARLEQGCIVALDDGRIIATWAVAEGIMTVDHLDPHLGPKRYERAGGDGRVLTLVPSELVSPHNAWSAFLDFHLDGLRTDLDIESFGSRRAMAILAQPTTWIGAATPEPAILSAFADPDKSDIPTPTKTLQGGVYELRESDGGVLMALCSLDGVPAFLQVAGFVEARGRTAVHLKPATPELVSRYAAARNSNLRGAIQRTEIDGPWTLTVLEGSLDVVLDEGGWVLDIAALRIGRWSLREEGLQLLGLEHVKMGLADHLRLEDGLWTLSGWGWRNLQEAATFSLRQRRPD